MEILLSDLRKYDRMTTNVTASDVAACAEVVFSDCEMLLGGTVWQLILRDYADDLKPAICFLTLAVIYGHDARATVAGNVVQAIEQSANARDAKDLAAYYEKKGKALLSRLVSRIVFHG